MTEQPTETHEAVGVYGHNETHKGSRENCPAPNCGPEVDDFGTATSLRDQIKAAIGAAMDRWPYTRRTLSDAVLTVVESKLNEAEAAAECLRAELDDQRKAKRTAAGAADRFRDVLCEALGYPDENPGDDVLVSKLREHFGKTGPEPTMWRDLLTGYEAIRDQINAAAREGRDDW